VIAFGVFDFAAEECCRKLVGFVADDQIPTAVRGLQFMLHVLVARESIEAGDDQVYNRLLIWEAERPGFASELFIGMHPGKVYGRLPGTKFRSWGREKGELAIS